MSTGTVTDRSEAPATPSSRTMCPHGARAPCARVLQSRTTSDNIRRQYELAGGQSRQRMRQLPRYASIALLLLSLPCGTARVLAQEPPDTLATIGSLNCDRKAGSVRVMYRVEEAFDSETRRSLESGLPVTFVHEITVTRRRTLWFRKVLARRRIEVTASLDTLTQQYALTRRADDGETETETTERFLDVERWMTQVETAFALPASGATLDVKVKVVYQRDFILFLPIRWPLSAIDEAECR